MRSRPNVTADAGGLCLQAGNAAILRGGSESFHSSRAIVAALRRGSQPPACPRPRCSWCRPRDRAAVGHDADHDRVHRRDRAARRALADRAGAARKPHPGDRASRRHLPRLCRQRRRPGQGAQDRAERQDAAHRRVRRDRDPAGRPRRCRDPCCRRSWPICTRPAARSRGDDAVRALDPAGQAGDRGGLAHRISRRHPRGARGRRRRTRRSSTSTTTARTTPTRS